VVLLGWLVRELWRVGSRRGPIADEVLSTPLPSASVLGAS
jgi:hypothetical protein